MPTEFNDPNEKFEVVEVEVFEEGHGMDATGFDAEAEIKLPVDYQEEVNYQEESTYQQESINEATQTRRRRARKPVERKYRKNKYGWAFFLCSMFVGLGLTATFDTPITLFLGMGLGFLFFVDPIYEKVMEKIENL